MSEHFTYILECADKTLYCGYTTDVDKRLATHNNGKGAKYTQRRLPVKLVAVVLFDNKIEAMQCEWWFKHKLVRQQKLDLIKTKKIKENFDLYQEKRQKKKTSIKK